MTRKNLLKAAVLFSCAAVLSVFLCSCKKDRSTDFYAMDTTMSLTVLDAVDESLLNEAQGIVNRLDRELSKTREDSDVFRLNEAGTLSVHDLSEDMLDVLGAALSIAEETAGTFDPTLGRLSDLWGFGQDEQAVPDAAAITETLKSCGYEHISSDGDSVTLADGAELDFGGIAKGYATDRLVHLFEQNGVENALISLGGNIYAMGSNHGKDWKVGIADPKDPGTLIGTIAVQDSSVVTSGNYQRYFEQNGTRYHHILDRTTGYPAESGLAGVTVVTPDSTKADGYSTALFVMGLSRGQEFVAEHDDLEAIWVQTDSTIVCSDGIKDAFTPIQS